MGKREVINPGWDFYKSLTYSPAVRKGNMLFISGMDGSVWDEAAGKPVVRGDIVQQTNVIFEKIKTVLEAAGASLDDIVATTDYIISTEKYRGTADVRRKYFKDRFPAATGVVVKSLLRPDALIEIDAIAVLD